VVFPDTPLVATIYLYVSGDWMDVTLDVYARTQIAITWGRQDWASTADTTKCPLTFNNGQSKAAPTILGRYSRKNPNSDLYGLLSLNTPVRVDLVTPSGLVVDRFEGHISSWPTRWDVSGKDVYTTVQANGIRRRLSQGRKPLRDPLRRHVDAHSPLAYWPLTDGETAIQGTEIVGGGSPMRAIGEAGSFYQGQPNWGKGSLAAWLDPVVELPDDTTGRLTARVAAHDITSWAVDHYRSGGGDGATPGLTIVDTGQGTDSDPVREWLMSFDNVFDLIQLRVTDRGETTSSSTLLATINDAGIADASPHMIRLSVTDDGAGGSDWAVIVDGAISDSGTHAVQNRAVETITYRWNLEDRTTPSTTITSDALVLGHLIYWGPDAPAAIDTWRAFTGHVRELAGRRIERVCAEQGVPLMVNGDLDLTPAMGPQKPGAFLDLLQSAADVDGGSLYESRDTVGLAYRTRASKYNQGV
jgi:hypothetical protein